MASGSLGRALFRLQEVEFLKLYAQYQFVMSRLHRIEDLATDMADAMGIGVTSSYMRPHLLRRDDVGCRTTMRTLDRYV